MTRWTRRQTIGALAGASGAAMLGGPAFAQRGEKKIPELAIWREEDGHILGEMTVNGETVVGMIDNGPVPVMLDRNWVNARNLDSPKNRTPAGLAVQSKGGQKLVIAGHKLTFDAALIDLEQIGLFRGKPLTVIIGRPVLEMGRVLLDFDAGVMQMQKRRAKPEIVTPSGMTVIRMLRASNSPFPTMEIAVEGTQLTADVRLGSGGTLDIEDGPLRDRWFSGGRPWSTVGGVEQGVTTSAESKNLIVTVSEVQVGPWKLRDVPVQISAPPPGQEKTARPRVVMGAELLSRFLLLYDARELELGFKPGAGFDAKFEKDMVGLGLRSHEGGGLLVMHVGENGPAESAGFKTQEVISAINGQKPERQTLWSAKAGDKVEFTLSDGAKRIVEAREYY